MEGLSGFDRRESEEGQHVVIADVKVTGDRVQCLMERSRRQSYVIYEVGEDGTEGFFEQYPGEVRWFFFNPSPEEREALRRVFESAKKETGVHRE